MEKRISERQLFILILFFLTVLSIRWLHYCWSNSVNLLFADQWDFYLPYFNGESYWGFFRRLHSPHRQGLGGITTFWVAQLSNWNTRWEAIHVAVIQILTTGLALSLKWKMTRKWSLWDTLIPLFFLSFSQYELPVLVANPAHSYWPNALLLMCAHAMLINRAAVRVGLISFLFFLLVHTGFGFLAAPVFILYYLYEVFQRRSFSLTGLILIVLSTAFFIYGHDFQTASPCDPHTVTPISQYLSFFIKLFGRVFGQTRLNIWPFLIFGLFITTTISFASKLKLKKLSENEKVLGALFGYSFTLVMVVTRVRACYVEPEPVRYVPFLLPAILSMIIFLQIQLTQRWSKVILIFLALLGFGFELKGPDKMFEISQWNEKKHTWVECWKQNEDFSYCKKKTNFEPYPMSERVRSRIEFLKNHKLNFYSE